MLRTYLARNPFVSAIASTSLLIALLAFVAVTPAQAQFGGPAADPPTQVHDTSALKPPPGAHVAIVEFEDMECPVCGYDNPTLREATTKYNIPWIRHDFPLQMHQWSFQAAVNSRWFDTKSKKLGDEYRDTVFANQASISTLDVLRTFTESFAKSHGLALPFAMDPQGTLSNLVKADRDLGIRIGIGHTPTIWVVVSGQLRGAPFREVQKPTQQLYQMIDQALADTKGK